MGKEKLIKKVYPDSNDKMTVTEETWYSKKHNRC